MQESIIFIVTSYTVLGTFPESLCPLLYNQEGPWFSQLILS